MKGEIEGLEGLFGILQNASQPYTSRRDGTRGSEREFVSDKDCVCQKPVHCRKGTTRSLRPESGLNNLISLVD